MQIDFESPIYSTIYFWINVGLFVYFTGNFFYILLVENSINANNEVRNQLKIIYSVISILKNIILGFALLQKQTKDISLNSPFPKDLNLDIITPNNKLN
jgi:hypothetical protein